MELTKLLGLIKDGESERVDFKKRAGRDIHHDIVALANAEGGYVLIGVDDEGNIMGVDVKKEKEVVTSSAQSIVPPPAMRLHKVRVGDRSVLVVEVERSDNLCSIGGVAYIRIGAGIRPLSIQEILVLSSEMGLVDWDGAPILGFDEAEGRYVDRFFDRLAEVRGRKVGRRDRKRYLRSIGAVRGDKLTNAGMLFFTEASEHIRHCMLRIVFMDDGMPAGSREFTGPVWRIVEEAMADITREVATKEAVISARRVKLHGYPLPALREALINAVAHRNYVIPSDIRVFIGSDSITFKSPGGVPPGLDLEEPDHHPRNPHLCSLLYDCGLIERYGLGIRSMREEVGRRPDVELEITARPQVFVANFKRKFEEFLDDTDRAILNALTGPMKSGEISKAVGISKPTCVNRLKKLVGMGLLTRSGAGAHVRYRGS